jgi:hypothetical protein
MGEPLHDALQNIVRCRTICVAVAQAEASAAPTVVKLSARMPPPASIALHIRVCAPAGIA